MEEESAENTDRDSRLSYNKVYKYIKYTLVLLVALTLGFMHYIHVSTIFENDRNFSHLSTIEREISLRTEMGFYYSYYKTIVEGQPFIQGVSKLMADRLVEYPKEINTFNRFNIVPELLIGAAYRYFEPWLNTSTYRQCHTVFRGDDVDTVESCVGVGEPIFFYLEFVWWLAGLMVVVVCLSAYSLSNCMLGGLIAVIQYFANHTECTRVQWAPNERENMAAPLIVLQMWLVGLQLRHKGRTDLRIQMALFILNTLCLLFWQFTQFIFLTQILIFFIMEQLKIIENKTVCIQFHAHFTGLHMAVLLLQGNDMLKTSLYTSFFIVLAAYFFLFSSLRIKVQNRLDLFVEAWLVVLRIFIVTTASFYLKHFFCDFLQIHDDTHIWEILFSKFTSYKNFHALLYTCSDAFDFLPLSSILNLTKTGLIPMVLLGIFSTVYDWFSNAKKPVRINVPLEDENDSGIENNADKDVEDKEEAVDETLRCLKRLRMDPEVVYHVAQLVVFAVMAGLVMRLKLLLGTQLCVLSALVFKARTDWLPTSLRKYKPWVWLMVVAWLWLQLTHTLTAELSHIGEFSDFQQEELLHWIMRETGARAAFAGSMPLMATVMLVTRRPIVAHPHYENKEARDRAYAVYKTYGKFPTDELYKELSGLKALYLVVEHKYCYGRSREYAVYKTYGKFPTDELYKELSGLKALYLVVEHKYCYGRSRKGCTFEDIWDIEAPQHGARPRACHTLLTQPVDHFYRVFRNDQYAVFRIHDYSVMYMPRSFDT